MKLPFSLIPLFTAVILFLPFNAVSKEKSFIREYTYQASEADSKISARAIAMGQVKQLLLEEIGSYVHSTFIVRSEEDETFREMSTSQVKSITAGISRTTILAENWNGEHYYLKVNMTIDEDFLKQRLDELAKDQEQLSALEELQRKTDSAFAEIERLRKQLDHAASEREKRDLQKQYVEVTKQLTDGNFRAEQPRMELVFVLDATGSMGSMIANAKDKIYAIATTMAQSNPAPELSIGIIAFRDRTDHFVTKQLPLTNRIDELYSQLLGIQASGGGDLPESVNQALAEAVFDFQWDSNPNTLKTIYLIGDSPPHVDYRDDIPYYKSCAAAAKRDIIINTIQCGQNASTTPVWQEIAQHTNGEFLRLNQSGNSFAVRTPYDEELSRKARDLDKTRVYYGDRPDSKNAERSELSENIYNQGRAEEGARRGIYNVTTVSGRNSFLGEDELIEAYEEGAVDVETLEDEELPGEMQGMTAVERRAYLDQKAKERKQLEEDIKRLNDKRNTYIDKELNERKDEAGESFNTQFHKVFKKQAVRKHFTAPSSPRF